MGSLSRVLSNGVAFAKATAAAIMVFVHCSVWLVSKEDVALLGDDFLTALIMRGSILGVFPLMIPALAGGSLYAFIRTNHINSVKSSDHMGHMGHMGPKYLWRAAGIDLSKYFTIFIGMVFLGYVTNVLSWGPSVSFDWDVLAFIGLSWLVIATLMKFGLGPLMDLLGIACFGLSSLTQIRYGNDWLSSIFLGNETGGFYWPFVPWFATVVFGFRLTEFLWHLEAAKTKEHQTRVLFTSWKVLVAVGFAALLIAMFSSERLVTFGVGNVWGGGIFKPGFMGLVAVCGALCLMIGIGALSLRDQILSRYGFVNSFATGILWIYVIHLIVGANLSYWLKRVGHLEVISLPFFLFEFALSWGVGLGAVYLKHHRIRLVLRKVSP